MSITRDRICGSTTLPIPTLQAPTGTGSDAREPEARRISGAALRRALAISTSRRQVWMDLAKTGRLIMRRFLHGLPKPSATWGWPAQCRIGRAIPMANICRRCPGVASTTSCKRQGRRLECRICPTGALSSRSRITDTRLPLLRKLQSGLRRWLVFLPHVVHHSGRRENQEPHFIDQCACPQRAGG